MTCIHIVSEPAGRLRVYLVAGSEKISCHENPKNPSKYRLTHVLSLRPARNAASRTDTVSPVNGPMTHEELGGNEVRQAWFPKNPGRWRVMGRFVISLPWLQGALPISYTPHHLSHTLAHIYLPVCHRSATGIYPSNEQPPSPDLLDGAEAESQRLEAGATRG